MGSDPSWQPPHPHSWREVYTILGVWLLACLAVAFLLDWLKAIL